MKKITERICNAFLDGIRLKISNTLTEKAAIWLHGNKIAFWATDEILMINLRGWNTVTTRERLNGLLTMLNSDWRIVQRNHIPYAINNTTNSYIFLIDVYWYGLSGMASGDCEWFNKGNPIRNRLLPIRRPFAPLYHHEHYWGTETDPTITRVVSRIDKLSAFEEIGYSKK